MSFRMEVACNCHVGCARANNEDNYLFFGEYFDQSLRSLPDVLYREADPVDGILACVFDGMGGGDYGEDASLAAAQRVHELHVDCTEGQPSEFLETAVLEANLAVNRKQEELGSRRMGSTMSALYFQGDSVYACNLGDSKIFGLREGKMLQISRDHTDEEFMKEQGIIGRKPRLTQFLGVDPTDMQLEPHIVRGTLNSEDLYLICSDGLTDMVDVEEIREILMGITDLCEAVGNLTKLACHRGGADNITIILCRVHRNPAWEENHEQHTEQHSMAGLGNRAQAGWRKLWVRLRDTAGNIRDR